MDDATLVSRAVGGDRDAFADIYDRYAGAVLDLCTAVLRDADEAAEATLDSFLRAARELVNLRDRSRLRLWLLAVARHEATARARRPRRNTAPLAVSAHPGGAASEGEPDAAGDVGAASAADADDPSQLASDPLRALSEPDRAILHLSLRHELDAEELGAVVGVRAATAEARAARLRSRAETAVGALLLSRADPGADPSSCRGLAEVLDGWDGRFTPAVGTRVERHVRRCEACRGRRSVLVKRIRAMASLPFLAPPAWLRREVLVRMELAVSPKPLAGWEEDGFPPGIDSPVRRDRRRPPAARRAPAAAAVGAILLAVAGIFILLRDDGRSSTVDAAGSVVSTVPPTTTAAGPATSGVTSTLTASTVPATSPPQPSTSVVSTTPTTQVAVAPTAPVAPVVDRDPPGVSFGPDAASSYVAGCPYSLTGVWAVVSDQSPVTSVTLHTRGPEGGESARPMTFDGGEWRATMGEFGSPGQAVFWVEAVDSEGNRGRGSDQAFEVYACQ